MNPLTRDELRDLRAARRCCTGCGAKLPPYPETQDGRPHACLRCLWTWKHGAPPSETWRSTA